MSQHAWPAGTHFEWDGRVDRWRANPVGQWVIGAGVAFTLSRPDPTWVESLEAFGFEYGEYLDWGLIARYFALESITASSTLGDQIADVAALVLDTLKVLGENPPGAPALGGTQLVEMRCEETP